MQLELIAHIGGLNFLRLPWGVEIERKDPQKLRSCILVLVFPP